MREQGRNRREFALGCTQCVSKSPSFKKKNKLILRLSDSIWRMYTDKGKRLEENYMKGLSFC